MSNLDEPQQRVMVLATHFAKGGAETQLSRLADALADRGFDVAHVSLARQSYDEVEGKRQVASRHSAGVEKFRSIGLFKRFWSLSSQLDPDFIISSVHASDCLAYLWTRFHRSVKWIMREPNYCQGVGASRPNRIRRHIGYRADAVVANNRLGFEFWNQIRSGRETYRVRNMLDRAAVVQSSLSAEAPALDSGQQYFVSVGRLENQKNLGLALTAFAQVADRLDDVRYLVVGSGSKEEELKTQARSLGIEHRVDFLGYVANPLSLIRHAKALILASRFEGLPNVAMEALALGTPLLLSRIPAHVDIFPSEIASFFDLDAPDGLAKQMLDLTTEFPQSVNERTDWVRDKLIESWSVDSVADDYIQVIQQLSSRKT